MKSARDQAYPVLVDALLRHVERHGLPVFVDRLLRVRHVHEEVHLWIMPTHDTESNHVDNFIKQYGRMSQTGDQLYLHGYVSY